jgi:hypothetical protein
LFKNISKIISLVGCGVAAYRAMYGMCLLCRGGQTVIGLGVDVAGLELFVSAYLIKPFSCVCLLNFCERECNEQILSMFSSLKLQFAYFVLQNHSSVQNALGHSNAPRPTAENPK